MLTESVDELVSKYFNMYKSAIVAQKGPGKYFPSDITNDVSKRITNIIDGKEYLFDDNQIGDLFFLFMTGYLAALETLTKVDRT